MKDSFTRVWKRNHIVVLLFTTCLHVTSAERLIQIENYFQQFEGELSFNFTRVIMTFRWSQIECFLTCNLDSSCIGVVIREMNETVDMHVKANNSIGERSNALICLKECPVQFTTIGDLTGCYHVVPQEVSWDEAEAACQTLDPQAHLVSFETRKELEVVSEHISMESDVFLTFWTGGKDHEENNQLTWTGTGELVPVDPDFWYNAGPQHGQGDCVSSYNDNLNDRFFTDLYNEDCGSKYPHVCEIH